MRLASFSVLVLALACDSSKEAAPVSNEVVSAAGEAVGGMTEYMRKSKSAEAKVNLRTIARSVEYASAEPSVALDGTVKPFVLTAAPLTPAAGSCCKQPKGKCAADPKAWEQPGWQALGFALPDPHYYSYELVVDGTGFIARAVGDLDCDGELATFELRGTAKPDGTYEIAAEPTSTNPLE